MTGRSLQLPLLLAAACLAFCVVGLGAFVRLSDAGLGCPDWPGCYGHLVGVPDSHAEHAKAALAFPGKPVEPAKAWKEMIHRYAAGTLGLLILGIAISAWRNAQPGTRPWLETALVGVVVFQAMLGMWTVTLLLKPVIVTAHLLGGMTTWGILAALTAKKLGAGRTALFSFSTALMAGLAIAAVAVQIALGGWVSSNYAALACADFPTCQGGWWPAASTEDYAHAFQIHRELGQTADGALLSQAALSAIHWSHRLGALATFVIVGAYALLLLSVAAMRRHGVLVIAALFLQVVLGVSNVLLSLPLPVAVAHNLGAALLLAVLAVSIVPGRSSAHAH